MTELDLFYEFLDSTYGNRANIDPIAQPLKNLLWQFKYWRQQPKVDFHGNVCKGPNHTVNGGYCEVCQP